MALPVTKFMQNGIDMGKILLTKQELSKFYPAMFPEYQHNELYGWGFNSSFQLGINPPNTVSPTLVNSETDWLSADVGNSHTIAIRNDGTLWTWGRNDYGQLGDETIINRSFPVQTITMGFNWSKVTANEFFTLALKTDGTLWTWGDNTNGQLGDNSTVAKSSPVQIKGTEFISIGSYSDHTGMVYQDGSLWTWGDNTYGQLGDGTDITMSDRRQISIPGHTVNKIYCGRSCTFAILDDATLYAWGWNNYGQLGTGDNIDSSTPIQIISETNWTKITTISSNEFHTAAISIDGTLWTWGDNANGQLGDNTNVSRSIPVQVGSSNDWKEVSCGAAYTVAIKQDGTLWGWGGNNNGELGADPEIIGYMLSTPMQLDNSTNWSQIDAGDFHTAAIKTDGTLWSWGGAYHGQLGNNNVNFYQYGFIQTIAGGNNWSQVSCSVSHTTAIKTDGTLWCWGRNNNGELGDGTFNYRSSPVQIQTAGTDWVHCCAGNYTSFFIKKDGSLFATGSNENGCLFGSNSLTNETYNTPELIIDPNTAYSFDWNKIANGNQYSVGIKIDGSLWCWGNNTSGQLGSFNTDNYSIPVQISTFGKDWSSVACGDMSTFSIKKDGSLWSWGDNWTGQLGSGDIEHRSSPVQVGSDTTWKQISAGSFQTAGIKQNGTLWGWGWNNNGQLGDGTIESRSSPVQTILNSNNWAQISCGYYHSAAIKTDGTLWTWGNNESGQLGNNDYSFSNVSVPVHITSENSNWTYVECGDMNTIALRY